MVSRDLAVILEALSTAPVETTRGLVSICHVRSGILSRLITGDVMKANQQTDALSVGNDHIDKQHAQILHLVKELEVHLDDELESEKTFFLLLSSLMLAITRHFRDEELLLEKNGCPWLSEQEKDHTFFVEKLSAILTMEEKEVPEQVVLFMKKWLETHLHRLDMKCKPYLEEH